MPSNKNIAFGDDYSRAIERVLRGPCGPEYFTDGPPRWTEGRDNRPPLSARSARTQQKRDIKRLKKHGRGDLKVEAIVKTLSTCRPGGRCLSGACVVCRRAAQRALVDAASAFFSRLKCQLSAVSVVDVDWLIELGGLNEGRPIFETIARSLEAKLADCGIRHCFGGFDISANEDRSGKLEPVYSIHFWGFVATRKYVLVGDQLRASFERDEYVRMPVRHSAFDGDPAGLAYCWKSTFVRRETQPGTVRADGKISRRNTRNRPLRVNHTLELAAALDRAGLGGRLFLHGMELVERHGQLAFVTQGANAEPNSRPEQAKTIRGHGRRVNHGTHPYAH